MLARSQRVLDRGATLSRSVPSASEAQATFCATLFDQWAQLGLTDVVISPGSRSTPLVLAAAATEGLTLHVRLDERSAGFFALGRSLATRRPVVVVVTSGTAATELHACVAEADLAFVPLIVVTADRPPDLHGVGAPQTIEQANLYGDMVRRFTDSFVVNFEGSPNWRGIAGDLWYSSMGIRPGPVHLNAAFLEPLVADILELPSRSGRYVAKVEPVVPEIEVKGQTVLCVVGRGVTRETIDVCRQLNWVVLGDATANGTLPYFDSLLRSADFVDRVRPDVVVRLGGLPASKVLAEQLREWSVRTIALEGAGFVADPDRLVSETCAGLPVTDRAELVGDEAYVTTWLNASREVGRWLEEQDRTSELVEPALARAVVAASNESGVALVVGSSMPVRDVEWWAPSRTSRHLRQPRRQRHRWRSLHGPRRRGRIARHWLRGGSHDAARRLGTRRRCGNRRWYVRAGGRRQPGRRNLFVPEPGDCCRARALRRTIWHAASSRPGAVAQAFGHQAMNVTDTR